MSQPRRVVAPPAPGRPDDRADLEEGFARIRAELDIPEAFPDAVSAAAALAAATGPVDPPGAPREDRRDLPLITIDPPGSRDLDQALHIRATDGGGSVVSYAIADVAAFVTPDDPIDQEAWARGVSRYSPDQVTPLHPRELSEGAASLLPDVDRPAVLWTMRLDADGHLTDTEVVRATVRSHARLTYAQAQEGIDHGQDPLLRELATVGRRRAEREWVRGGVSLELPDQEVARRSDGSYTLEYRAPLAVEGWNAQISLLTGMAAGQLMVDAGIGVLRTLPAPEVEVVDGLRLQARALGLPWPTEIGYADFVRTLDPHEPVEAAMISVAAVGLRGAGYVTFVDGDLPSEHRHEAIAAEYAHVTAPLRRLVDRYASEVALSVHAGRPVPEWVLARMDALPKAMGQARGRAGALDRAVLDLVEAQVLAPHLGESFAGTVVRSGSRGSQVQLRQPAASVWVGEVLPIAADVVVRLVAVDLDARTVRFEVIDPG